MPITIEVVLLKKSKKEETIQSLQSVKIGCPSVTFKDKWLTFQDHKIQCLTISSTFVEPF